MKYLFFILNSLAIVHVVSSIQSSSSSSSINRLSRIAFGSCNTPSRPSMWSLIHQQKPDQLLLLGDNIYADREPGGNPIKSITSPLVIQELYNEITKDPAYKRLQSSVEIMATIDDHDYGQNNGDKTFKYRIESQKYFWDFLNVPIDSKLRKQNGVYSSKVVERTSQFLSSSSSSSLSNVSTSLSSWRYKIILLDTRSNKDPTGTIHGDYLGEEQWNWFQSELQEPNIDLILIGSSIQILPTHKLVEEGWNEFSDARTRLLDLIVARAQSTNVMLLSGDVHCGEILHAKCYHKDGKDKDDGKKEKNGIVSSQSNPLHLYEVTSSGLSHTFTYLVTAGEDGELDIATRGLHFDMLYNFYQAVIPARYREQHFADHFQGPHFVYIDIIEEQIPEERIEDFDPSQVSGFQSADGLAWFLRKLEVNFVDHLGSIALKKSIPLRVNFGASDKELIASKLPRDSSTVDYICEPFWGEVSPTRHLVTRAVLAAMLLTLVVFPALTMIWFVGASGYYVLFGAELERRRKILEGNVAH